MTGGRRYDPPSRPSTPLTLLPASSAQRRKLTARAVWNCSTLAPVGTRGAGSGKKRPMTLTLQPTGLSSPIDRDRADYVVSEDGRAIGRIYEDHATLPKLRWFWAITLYLDPKRGDHHERTRRDGAIRRGVGGARAGTEGNARQPSTRRTPSRESVTQGVGSSTAATCRRYPRWEPYAGKPQVRICAGGAR
jgi:hypothetical protein